MYVVDMREFLRAPPEGEPDTPDPGPAPEAPDTSRRIGAYFGRLVEAATASTIRGREFATTVRCRRRPNRQGCAGRIEVLLTDVPSRLDWWCSRCGDSGLIANWRGTPWDLSIPAGQAMRGEIAWVHMPEDVHRALETLEYRDQQLLRIVRGAESDMEDVLIGGPVILLALLRDHLADRIPSVASQRGRRLLDQAHFLLDVCCVG